MKKIKSIKINFSDPAIIAKLEKIKTKQKEILNRMKLNFSYLSNTDIDL